MPDWFSDFLCGASLTMASDIWNSVMGIVTGILTNSPRDFSTGTWAFVSAKLYPWALAIGVSMLNLFFIIAMWQALKNLHQNITMEMVIEALIKIVFANVIFVNLKSIIMKLFTAASEMAGEVLVMTAPTLKVNDIDIGSVLFYQIFGLLFILVAIVCSILILITVYSRYIKLYILMVLAPFAVPTVIGGPGIENTFQSWCKTFILNVFEVVVIAMTLVISWKLSATGLHFGDAASPAGSVVDGFWDAMNSLFTMVLVTASVSGANSLLSKALGL